MSDQPKVCPICKGGYPRTYEEHTGSAKHRLAVAKATGRTNSRANSLVRCAVCRREAYVDFATCLRSGWPKCCRGYTMTLVETKADIDAAVGGIVRDAQVTP